MEKFENGIFYKEGSILDSTEKYIVHQIRSSSSYIFNK